MSLDDVLSKPPTEIAAGLAADEHGPAVRAASSMVSAAGLAVSETVLYALQIVREAGYVAIKAASHRKAQERVRIAEALREDAAKDAEHARGWARDCLTEERRLRDRLTFVYGVAMAHGATREELAAEAFPRSFSDPPGSDVDK